MEVAASVLTVGSLELEFGGTVTTSVEIPAGSVKRYELDGPIPLTRRQLTVRLLGGDGREIAAESLRLRVAGDELLVGLLGIEGIETAVRSATTAPLGRPVTVLTVGSEDAERLGPLAYVIVGSGALAQASVGELSAIADWVEEAGRLYGPDADVVLVAETGAGAVFRGTDLVVTRTGAGEVGLLVDPAGLDVADWSRILRDRPSGTGVVDPDEFAFREPDPQLAADVTAATGGRIDPAPEDVHAAAPTRGAAERDLWPWLVGAALALFLADVALRRLVMARGDLGRWREALINRRRPMEALATPRGATRARGRRARRCRRKRPSAAC